MKRAMSAMILAFSLLILVGCNDEGELSCDYEGQTYQLGESRTCTDQCNTCICLEGGFVATAVDCGSAGADAR